MFNDVKDSEPLMELMDDHGDMATFTSIDQRIQSKMAVVSIVVERKDQPSPRVYAVACSMGTLIRLSIWVTIFLRILTSAEYSYEYDPERLLDALEYRVNHHSRRKQPLGRYGKFFRPLPRGSSTRHMSMANMTCQFFTQPLNHFALPKQATFNSTMTTFRQRYCVYNGFVPPNQTTASKTPVLLYTGNESPLDEYINNTGLIWEVLGPKLQAQVIFVEHRYEGQSFPSPDIPNCLAYSSSIQALADYANFIELHVNKNSIGHGRRPVIALGGSYGGMLSGWLRMKYPQLVAGAIAASAPIYGFPRIDPTTIDSAFQVIKYGLQQPYPPTADTVRSQQQSNGGSPSDDNHCAENLLAAWPLIQVLGRSKAGRNLLTESFSLCQSMNHPDESSRLIEWAQSPWFDLAEGSFPYESGYIVFALTHNPLAKLPPWPLQAACWKNSSLYQSFGIQFNGNVSNVSYAIHFGDDDLVIDVDWDNATVSGSQTIDMILETSPSALRTMSQLLTNVRDAVSIWFNVTKDVKCYNLTVAPNLGVSGSTWAVEKELDLATLRQHDGNRDISLPTRILSDTVPVDYKNNSTRIAQCWNRMTTFGSWPPLCCNEDMNLIITVARGLGNDVFWPPSHPRGTTSYEDVVASLTDKADSFCDDPNHIFGFPSPKTVDPWSTWYDVYYGGSRIESHSNIIFSNGLLDPWSAAGVYGTEAGEIARHARVPGLSVQELGREGSMMAAVVMDNGGHHTDLMYSSSKDPPDIVQARIVETDYVLRWIDQWNSESEV